MLFLCGFLISLSSVLSLKCYDWFCYELSCFKQETRQCDSSGNFQCRRLEFYLSPRENVPPGHVLAASCSTHCDQEEVCSKLSGNVSDCRVTCCNTDLCNDPGKYQALVHMYLCIRIVAAIRLVYGWSVYNVVGRLPLGRPNYKINAD